MKSDKGLPEGSIQKFPVSKERFADDPHPGAVLQPGGSAAVLCCSDGPFVEGAGILEPDLPGEKVVFPLHLLIVEADAAVRCGETWQVAAMEPEVDALVIGEKTQRIMHRVRGGGLFYLVERRLVPATEGVDAEIAGWGAVFPVAGSDRKRECQFAILIGAEELFEQVHEDVFFLTGGFGVGDGKRGIRFDVIEVPGDLDGYTGGQVATVDPVEAEHVRPAVAKERLRRFPLADPAAIPGNGRITRMEYAAEIGDLSRFPPGRYRGDGREDQEQ